MALITQVIWFDFLLLQVIRVENQLYDSGIVRAGPHCLVVASEAQPVDLASSLHFEMPDDLSLFYMHGSRAMTKLASDHPVFTLVVIGRIPFMA